MYKSNSRLQHDVLDRFPNDHAVCAGVWLRTGHGFVPQGVTVAGGTAWVSGFDGNAGSRGGSRSPSSSRPTWRSMMCSR